MRMYAMAYNTQAQFEADEYFVKVARQIEHLEAKLEAIYTMAYQQLDGPNTPQARVCHTLSRILDTASI